MKTFFYVDAFNLYYGALKGSPYRWLNLEALFSKAFPQNEIASIKYFTALVNPLADNPQQPLRQQLYLRALRTLSTVEIFEGHYLSHKKRLPLAHPSPRGPKCAEVIVTEEKGSDVNLASHLLVDALKGRFDCAIVVSGDSDLATPIEMARAELGKPVGVLLPQLLTQNPKKPRKSARLRLAATFFRNGLRPGVLGASQFPPSLTDTAGEFHKPPHW